MAYLLLKNVCQRVSTTPVVRGLTGFFRHQPVHVVGLVDLGLVGETTELQTASRTTTSPGAAQVEHVIF